MLTTQKVTRSNLFDSCLLSLNLLQSVKIILGKTQMFKVRLQQALAYDEEFPLHLFTHCKGLFESESKSKKDQRTNKKSKTGVSVAPSKRTDVLHFFKKKKEKRSKNKRQTSKKFSAFAFVRSEHSLRGTQCNNLDFLLRFVEHLGFRQNE